MTRRLSTYVVLAVVAALVLTGCKFDGAYDLPLPGGNSVGKGDGYTVTADFNDVLNVVPRSPVMVSDVPVGQVTEVDRVGWHARITMRIRNDIDLPDNAAADIRQTSLLGEKYVALVKPAKPDAGRLSNGDHIPLSSTGRNPEVEEVLGALSFLLSGGGVGQLKTISEETNKIMTGRSDRIRSLLTNLDSLVGTLDDQKQDIIAAMESINRLSSTLEKEKGTVTSAIDAVGPAVDVLDQQHAALIRMLRQLDKLGTVGTRVLNASKDNTLATLRNLQPILRQLANAGDSLPKGLSTLVSFPFPKEASDIVKGDYANALFHLDVNLSDLSTAHPTTLPSVVGDACKLVTGTVKSYARVAIRNLPLSAAQKTKLENAIVDRVMASIDCDHPGDIPSKVVKALLYLLTKGGLGLPTIPLPTSLPSGLPLPGLGNLGLRSSWRSPGYDDSTSRDLDDLLTGSAS